MLDLNIVLEVIKARLEKEKDPFNYSSLKYPLLPIINNPTLFILITILTTPHPITISNILLLNNTKKKKNMMIYNHIQISIQEILITQVTTTHTTPLLLPLPLPTTQFIIPITLLPKNIRIPWRDRIFQLLTDSHHLPLTNTKAFMIPSTIKDNNIYNNNNIIT